MQAPASARCADWLFGILAFAFAAGTACSSTESDRHVTSRQPASAAVAAPGPAALPVHAEPFSAAAIAAARSGPVAVAGLLAQWDTAGFPRGGVGAVDEELKARDSLICYLPDTRCENEEAGWDAFTVVDGYNVTLLWQRGDSAQARVAFTSVGEYAPSADSPSQVARSSEPFIWTPRFLRLNGGWRVTGVESAEHPALSIAVARRKLARTAADTALLDSLARDGRGRRDP